MVVNAFVFEIRGGAILAEFRPAEASWEWQGNPAETVSVTVNLANAVEAARGWSNLGSAWNHGIAVDIGGRYLGGPILPHDFAAETGKLQLSARGLRAALAYRNVLPVSALTQPLVDAEGAPRAEMDTVITGVDYGTVGKRLLQQACEWPSWVDVPIAYHPDRPGIAVQAYPAVDMMDVDRAWENLAGLENGPDIRLELRRTGDAFGWEYRSGTATAPRLQSESVFSWEIGRTSQLKIRTNPTSMGSVSWSFGGRSQDRTLVDMLYDPYLVDMGGLLLEQSSKASSNTSTQDTLRKWNTETLRTARRPWEFWSFRVPANQSPWPFEYGPGDLVEVVITDDEPVPGGYIPAGSYIRRIASLSGEADGQYVTITCGENYDAV
jgi:hypothetical protein